ncbi:MAG: hypothetical protein VX044_10735 [Planctomycetota bacterium]|nr:hypothetical protein [Planctomycetota bacterium]
MHRLIASLVLASSLLCAQDPSAPVAEPPEPALPAANSAEALQLVDTALDKLAAYGRGRFSTTEAQDQAMLRDAGLPIGAQETEVDGGWHRDMVWADADGREFIRANGRMLAKVDGAWRLRRDKLAGGVPAPFTLDPQFFLTVLKQMPASARRVVHVEAGKLKGKPCAILSCKLEGDDALELADSGAFPDAGGGFGGVVIMGALGGLGMEPPRPELETYLAFFVDPASGDLLRFAAKTYQTDTMMGGVAIQIGGAGGGFVEEEDDEEEEAAEGGPVRWKRGFPRIKPKKDQSVLSYRVDFKDLGLAKAPELSGEHKALLRTR